MLLVHAASLPSPDVFRISKTGIDGGGMSKLELESSPTVTCLPLVLPPGSTVRTGLTRPKIPGEDHSTDVM